MASAFAYQKHFATIRALMLPANGLSFHFQKIKDYPESGFFFQCAFTPHPAALSDLRDVDWHSTLNSCPSFNFSCPARDRKTRMFKQVQVRVEVITAPLQDFSSSSSNPIQCYILFNPVLLSNPLTQICEALESINLANCSLMQYLSIPPPLAGKHASAHTKQIALKIPFLPDTDSEQLLYNLTLAHFKGLLALSNHPEQAPSDNAILYSLSLRLPMVTDFLARRALSPKLQDYFVQLLDSVEFSHISRKKIKVDRRGILHEGTSAASSANESEPEGLSKIMAALHASANDAASNSQAAPSASEKTVLTSTAKTAASPVSHSAVEIETKNPFLFSPVGGKTPADQTPKTLTDRQKVMSLKANKAGGAPQPPMKP
jgi:hypothetical protein